MQDAHEELLWNVVEMERRRVKLAHDEPLKTSEQKSCQVSVTNTHQEAFDETRGPVLQQVKSSSAHRIYIQLIIDPGGFDGGPLCVKTSAITTERTL